MLRVIILVLAVVGLLGAWYLILPTGKSEKTYPVVGFNRLIVADDIWAKVYTGEDGGVRGRVLRGDIENLKVTKSGRTLEISVNQSNSISATATEDGSVTIYGVCNQFNAFAESEGAVNAGGLECLNVSADARSEGTIETTAIRRAELNAIGGRIVMSGGAEVARERSLLGGEIIRP